MSILQFVRYADHVYDTLDKSQAEPTRVYLVMQWIFAAFDKAPYNVQCALKDHILRLREQYTLTSGQKLLEIWAVLLPQELSMDCRTSPKRLDSLVLDDYLTNCEFLSLRDSPG